MGALKVFGELIKTLRGLPKLVKLNSDGRQQIRDAAGTVADELTRGLQLVGQRISGAQTIVRTTEPGRARDRELQKYLDESQRKLFDAFAEFKICRSLRTTRAQFKELFGLPKLAASMGTGKTIQGLLAELEMDERMIIDEVGPMLRDLRRRAGSSESAFHRAAEQHKRSLLDREERVRRLAREVHDKM
jgi:hypothetical protein